MWAISIDGEQIRDDLLFVLRENPDFYTGKCVVMIK